MILGGDMVVGGNDRPTWEIVVRENDVFKDVGICIYYMPPYFAWLNNIVEITAY